MSSTSLALVSVALLFIGGAGLLWTSATARTRQHATAAFVEQQLARFGSSIDTSDQDLRPGASRQTIPGLANLLLRAGINSERRFLTLLLIFWIALVAIALIFGGVLSAAVLFLLYGALAYFRLWLRASKRSRVIVRQLPPFIDSIVRLVTIGTSLPSAFQEIAPQSDLPLRDVLVRVSQLTQAGIDLHVAMRQVARIYRVEELFLIASVIGVSTRFGGRVDQVLERMSAFMRDLEQARQELVALSAETRLSAWILGLLPIGIAGFIVIFNNAMFTGMWRDPLGMKLLVGAVVLQVVGSFLLYRLAKSV